MIKRSNSTGIIRPLWTNNSVFKYGGRDGLLAIRDRRYVYVVNTPSLKLGGGKQWNHNEVGIWAEGLVLSQFCAIGSWRVLALCA